MEAEGPARGRSERLTDSESESGEPAVPGPDTGPSLRVTPKNRQGQGTRCTFFFVQLCFSLNIILSRHVLTFPAFQVQRDVLA